MFTNMPMKKLLLSLVVITILVTPAVVAAIGDFGIGSAISGTGLLQTKDTINQSYIATVISRILQPFVALVGVVLFGFIIYGGYLWLTAGGDDQKVTSAKTIIKNGIIGLIIVLSAYIIITLALDLLQQAVNPTPASDG